MKLKFGGHKCGQSTLATAKCLHEDHSGRDTGQEICSRPHHRQCHRIMSRNISYRRIGVILVILLLAALAIAWFGGLIPQRSSLPPANAIMVIMPYRYAGTWVFDDPRAGLVREPFVAGVPEMIDAMVAGIPDATNGFRLTFSAHPFPGYQNKLLWLRGDSGGNYYRLDGTKKQGWLCPAMFHYYQTAPKELYVKAEPKT